MRHPELVELYEQIQVPFELTEGIDPKVAYNQILRYAETAYARTKSEDVRRIIMIVKLLIGDVIPQDQSGTPQPPL